MKFLFSEAGHECETVRDGGFSGKENGELLALADKDLDVLVTIDRKIPFQQNLAGKRIAILIIRALQAILMTFGLMSRKQLRR